MSFEIEKVALLRDSKSEKIAVANALKMAKLHIAGAQKAAAAGAKKWNKCHKIGSFFIDKDGELCKTAGHATLNSAKNKVVVPIEYIASGGGWCDIETSKLSQPHYIKLLFEWLNEPSDTHADLNEVEFENLRTICENTGLNMGAQHVSFSADDQWVILEKGRETIEFRNIDFVETETLNFDDDDLSWLGQGNCRD
jgi:hypothetical protein